MSITGRTLLRSVSYRWPQICTLPEKHHHLFKGMSQIPSGSTRRFWRKNHWVWSVYLGEGFDPVTEKPPEIIRSFFFHIAYLSLLRLPQEGS